MINIRILYVWRRYVWMWYRSSIGGCERCGASCCTRPHGHKGLCLGECDVHWKIAESNHLPFDLLCRNVRSNDAAVFSGWKDSPRFVVTWYYLKYVKCDLMRLLWEYLNQIVESGQCYACCVSFVSCKGRPWLRDCPHLSTSEVYPSRCRIQKLDLNLRPLKFQCFEIALWIFLKCLTVLYVLFDFMMQYLQLRWIKACQTMHDGMMCMSMYVRLFLWKDVYRRFFQVLEQSHTIKTKHNTPSNAKSTSWGR